MNGFRLSLAGAMIFFAGLFSLLVLPAGLAIAAILIGGGMVWGGFIWTLFGRYVQQPPAAPPEA